MINRYCMNCGRLIAPGVAGNLCLKCKLDRSPESEDRSPYYSELLYDVRDIAHKTGLKERTIRRWAHDGHIPGRVPEGKIHRFTRTEVDKWFKAGRPILKTPKTPNIPTNPLQEEALARCRKKDHSWLSEPKYDDIAYTSKPTTVKQTKYTVLAGYKRTCYFCKYSTFVLA